jgi:ribosome-binding ATPase YchF (GTP1/OBG family)
MSSSRSCIGGSPALAGTRREVPRDNFEVIYVSWKGAKEKGVVRSEGKEYIVADGDVLLFRFNV